MLISEIVFGRRSSDIEEAEDGMSNTMHSVILAKNFLAHLFGEAIHALSWFEGTVLGDRKFICLSVHSAT